MWSALFDLLGVKLLYSTAYHPQTDGSSERTNQTAEIALRFYIHTLDKPELWPTVLPRMQALLNNSKSSTTSQTANKVAYGFTPNTSLDLLQTTTSADKTGILTARATAKDAINFTNVNYKHHYDRRHQPMFMKVGDQALLRLHKGYSIPSTANVTNKLSQQYIRPFRIIEKVGRLAYRLQLPEHWTIHPVFTVAQLEPWQGPDPFNRPHPNEPPSVFVEGDNDVWKSWELDKLLNKRVMRKGRGYATEYLVRWKGWGPEHDKWINVRYLDNATELIDEYEQQMTTANPSNIIRPTPPPEVPPRRPRGRPRKN